MQFSEMSVGDYLSKYATYLAESIRKQARPVHDVEVDEVYSPKLNRTAKRGQDHSLTAAAKVLKRQKSVILVCGCGTGKTFMSLAVGAAFMGEKAYRTIIMSPSHIAVKWEREILDTVPNAHVVHLESYHDCVPLVNEFQCKPVVPEFYIVTHNASKMEPSWEPRYEVRLAKNLDGTSIKLIHCPDCGERVTKERGKLVVDVEHADLASTRSQCPHCKAQLWQHVSGLDRWPIASFVSQKLRNKFDFLILDEAHKAKGDDTAIGISSSKLITACKKVILNTGTLLGGYAYNIRSILFRLDAKPFLERGFTWEDVKRFDEVFGRQETVEVETLVPNSNKQSRGGRKTTRVKTVPGIMPTLFELMIDKCIFLNLEDISDDLPKFREELVAVDMDNAQQSAYESMEDALRQIVARMLRSGNKKMLSTMLQVLLGWPDHPHGYGALGYTEIDEDGRERFVNVMDSPSLDKSIVRPKEKQLVNDILGQVALGGQVWVYTTMVETRDVATRICQLIRDAGVSCEILRSKVAPKKREEWIAKQGRKTSVIISHPQLVETGLDFFDRDRTYNFSSIFFYQTGYSIYTLRQAALRAFRIGQWEDCLVRYYYYTGTMQESAMTLMGTKLSASEMIEGKFSDEGLASMCSDVQSDEVALAKMLVDNVKKRAKDSWK